MLKKLLYIFLVICTMRACGTAGGLDTKFFNPGGTLPPGTAGLITTDFGVGSNDVANAVAIQADGRIVAVGSIRIGAADFDFALARYNPDGNLDQTFGTGGKVTTDFGGLNDTANAVAIQADGRIVAVGSIRIDASNSDFALARYNTDGSLDLTFNGTGKVTTDFGGLDAANAVVIQADGKIVAVGVSRGVIVVDFALARYNTDGSLDSTFGIGGKVTTDFGGLNDTANAVSLQTDGRIVAVGQSSNDFALARYNTDGSLDLTFNGTGKVTTDFAGPIGTAFAVSLQTDGRIVAVGQSNTDFALARYNTDGSLDFSFNGTGMVTTSFGGGPDRASEVLIQADGKIVAVGTDFGVGSNFALARYNADGSLDLSFNGTGKVTTDFGGTIDQANAMAIQADGKIFAVGFSNVAGTNDFALARYLANVPSISTTLTIARVV